MISISWHFVKRDVVHSCCFSKRETTRNTDARQTQWWSLSMPGKRRERERESVQTCARVLQYSLAHSRARVRVHTYFAWRSRTVDVQNNRHLSSLSASFSWGERVREIYLSDTHVIFLQKTGLLRCRHRCVRAFLCVSSTYESVCVCVSTHWIMKAWFFFGFDVCEKENGSGQHKNPDCTWNKEVGRETMSPRTIAAKINFVAQFKEKSHSDTLVNFK